MYLTAIIQLNGGGLTFAPKSGNIQNVSSEILGDGKTVRLSHSSFNADSTLQATTYELYDDETTPVANASIGYIDVSCSNAASVLRFFSMQALIMP